MSWETIAAVAAAVSAVVGAVAALTGQLGRMWRWLHRRKADPERRLQRASTPDEARNVFLTSADEALAAVRSLDNDVASGVFAASLPEILERAQLSEQTTRDAVARLRRAAQNLQDRLRNGPSPIGDSATRTADEAEQALHALQPLARLGVLAADQTLAEIRADSKGHLTAAEEALAFVRRERPS